MVSIYEELAADVAELLTIGDETFGQAITLKRPAVSVEPANPWEKPTFGSDTTYTLKAAAEGVTPARLYGQDLIEAGDLVVTIAPFDTEPEMTDLIVINSEEFRIVSIEPIPADKTNLVAWEVIARKMAGEPPGLNR